MEELFTAIDQLAALLPTIDPEHVDTDQLGPALIRLTALRDRLDGTRHRLTAEQARRAAWRDDGAHSQTEWLRDRCRLSAGAAAGQVRSARHLAELPATAAALADGTISGEQAEVAARAARDLPEDALAGLDTLVAETGANTDTSALRTAVDDYAQRSAPDALEQRERRAWRARRLHVTRSGEGAAALDGRLDLAGGETVLTALTALTALAALSAPRDAADPRTPEQRRADALVELARRALDRGDLPHVGQVRPHVTVVVDLATLTATSPRTAAPADPAGTAGPADPAGQAGPADTAGPADSPGTAGASGLHWARRAATLDRLGAVCAETARRIACDATATRVVTGPASQPLDVGRAARVVTVAQRRALAVRDRGCIGCKAPVAWTEAHHVKHWADGGP